MVFVVESVSRLPLAIVGMMTLGLIGAPIAGMLTASISGLMVHHWTVGGLGRSTRSSEERLQVNLVRAAVLAGGTAIALIPTNPSWTAVLFTAASVGALGIAVLFWADPALARAAYSFKHWYTNHVRPNAAAA
jgi:hypothetical protein